MAWVELLAFAPARFAGLSEAGMDLLPRMLFTTWQPAIPSVRQLLHGGPCCSTLQRILRVRQDKQALPARFAVHPSRGMLSAMGRAVGVYHCRRLEGRKGMRF